jgi:hypothetical protein
VVEFRGVQWFSGESFSGEEEGREGVEEEVGVVEEVGVLVSWIVKGGKEGLGRV